MSERRTRRLDRSVVEDRLDRVTDPELDRSIVELEYVDGIEIDGGEVSVTFTLPTAWCSPAFAWMMASDARDELAALEAVSDVTVRLDDHMHADQVNEGVNGRVAFEEVFEDADDDIEAVRRTLDEKARIARQYRAVEALLDGGLKPAQIVRLTREDVVFDPEGDRDRDRDRARIRIDDALSVCVRGEPIRRYLEKATALGVATSTDVLFTTPEGDPISRGEFETVHRRGRLAETNMSGQGHVCANLGEARIGGPSDD